MALGLFLVAVANAAGVPGAGDTPPTFLGYGLDARKVSLESYRGKVVVISFWATWCGPCRRELPILESIQRVGKGDVQVIAINTESRDVYRRAAKSLKSFTLQLTNDESHTAQDAYGVKGLPHLVVIGKDMRIISVREGYDHSELDAVSAELNSALRAQLPQGSSSPAQTPQ